VRQEKTDLIKLYHLFDTNDSTVNTGVYLQLSLNKLENGYLLLEEKVFDESVISPQFGGNFSRILSFESKQVIQKFYLPNGNNCDSSKIDTLSYLFFSSDNDTVWNSFDDVKYRVCSELQLLERYRFQNSIKSTSEEIVLSQGAIANLNFQNIYTFEQKSLKLKKVRYVRYGKYYEFEPKNDSKYITFNNPSNMVLE